MLRSDAINEIKDELVRNKVYYTANLDPNLWVPYESYIEMIDEIEVGEDKNDIEFIDRRKVNEFKEKMIKAIRERGPQLMAEKVTKASSDLEKVRLKAIGNIEKELQNRGLKIEDLEEEYHNYEKEINSLSKKFKIRSLEDKIMDAIRRKSQSGRFETKQGISSWEEKPEQLGQTKKETISPSSSDFGKEFGKEPKKVEEKEFQGSKYDNWTKEELIKKIEELEAEIRELKSEKVEKDELPEFQSYLNKKESELKDSKEKLSSISRDYDTDLKLKPEKNNNFYMGWFAGGTVLLVIGGLVILFIKKKTSHSK